MGRLPSYTYCLTHHRHVRPAAKGGLGTGPLGNGPRWPESSAELLSTEHKSTTRYCIVCVCTVVVSPSAKLSGENPPWKKCVGTPPISHFPTRWATDLASRSRAGEPVGSIRRRPPNAHSGCAAIWFPNCSAGRSSPLAARSMQGWAGRGCWQYARAASVRGGGAAADVRARNEPSLQIDAARDFSGWRSIRILLPLVRARGGIEASKQLPATDWRPRFHEQTTEAVASDGLLRKNAAGR